jgi:hypothetical protein
MQELLLRQDPSHYNYHIDYNNLYDYDFHYNDFNYDNNNNNARWLLHGPRGLQGGR